jgi:hypothetical protein
MKAPSEKHLEDWIVNNLDYFGDAFDKNVYGLLPIEDPLWINSDEYTYPFFSHVLKRQARFPFGIADLITTDGDSICAVELKAGAVDGETIAQVLRYMHALRHIYSRVSEQEHYANPDVAAHYDYWGSLVVESGAHVIRGVVVGNGIKDRKILSLSPLLGIDIVVYDYDPATDFYRFNTESSWIDNLGMSDAADDYATGIIGNQFRSIIAQRTAKNMKRKASE